MKETPVLWLVKKVKKRIPELLVMTAADVANALLGVWFALGTRAVINAAVSGVRADFLRACGVQAGIIAGILLTLALYRHLHGKLEAELDRDWKKMLLKLLLEADYPAVSRYHSGELLNRLNNDVRIVDDGILSVLPSCAAMVARLGGALAVLFSLEWRFALLLVAGGALLLLIAAVARHRLKTLNKQVGEAEGKVSGLLQETLEKLLLVQAMDLTTEMQRRTDAVLGQRYRVQKTRKNVAMVANTGISVLYYLAGFGALVWCAVGMLNNLMTFGDLTAVTQLVSQIQAPFVNLSGVIPKYAAMLASAERLMELEELPKQSGEMLPRDTYEKMDAILAEELSFAYDRDEVLSGLSFRLPKNCFAVITGPSGKGKSTILKLLMGIFHPNGGRLYLQVDGEKILAGRSTRRLFAYVPQGNLLFSGTIRENLLVVNPDADADAIRQATYVSAMDDYLSQLPEGLDTVLGESGAGLSEGQSQRLAIARAILGGAPVLLLDEATSALDEITEQRVLERIRAIPGKTCIAVTHRPAAKEMADFQLELS